MERFEEYLTITACHVGHADRVRRFRGYCAGTTLPRNRKSVEPMAARVAPTASVIALRLINEAIAAGTAPRIVVVNAGYGINTAFRNRLSVRKLQYDAGVTKAVGVWSKGKAPLPPAPWSGHGRTRKLLRPDAQHKPVSRRALAAALDPHQWKKVT